MRPISEEEFDQATASGLVLIDFGAEWCGPCKTMLPILQRLGQELEGKLALYTVDIDHSPSLASRHGVMSVPTMLVFKEGKAVDRIVGTVTEGNLRKKIQSYLGAN